MGNQTNLYPRNSQGKTSERPNLGEKNQDLKQGSRKIVSNEIARICGNPHTGSAGGLSRAQSSIFSIAGSLVRFLFCC